MSDSLLPTAVRGRPAGRAELVRPKHCCSPTDALSGSLAATVYSHSLLLVCVRCPAPVAGRAPLNAPQLAFAVFVSDCSEPRRPTLCCRLNQCDSAIREAEFLGGTLGGIDPASKPIRGPDGQDTFYYMYKAPAVVKNRDFLVCVRCSSAVRPAAPLPRRLPPGLEAELLMAAQWACVLVSNMCLLGWAGRGSPGS